MKKAIGKGDLLKSNPLEGYWVCSVVLSFQPKSVDFNAMSHVAITNAVFEHDFDVSEIDLDKLKIIHTRNHEKFLVPCIEIHASKLVKEIEVISQLDVEFLYPHHLEFKVGNGSDEGWPQCGPLTRSLGYQAVHQWRKVNDREAWLKDIVLAEKSHTEMLERLRHV